jgi:hypothetical protein
LGFAFIYSEVEKDYETTRRDGTQSDRPSTLSTGRRSADARRRKEAAVPRLRRSIEEFKTLPPNGPWFVCNGGHTEFALANPQMMKTSAWKTKAIQY